MVLAPLPGLPSPQSIGDLYRRAASSKRIETAALQAGLLGGGSDAISQSLHALPLDSSHVAAMSVLSAVLSGAFNCLWLERLESAIPGPSPRAVLSKTVADYTIAGTLANSAYLVAVPALTALFAGASAADALTMDGWTVDGFRAVMLIELCTFAPYNLFAFRLVPPRMRPLSAAAVSASCTVALSGVTLGFGF